MQDGGKLMKNRTLKEVLALLYGAQTLLKEAEQKSMVFDGTVLGSLQHDIFYYADRIEQLVDSLEEVEFN
jgi:hypothetical protein